MAETLSTVVLYVGTYLIPLAILIGAAAWAITRRWSSALRWGCGAYLALAVCVGIYTYMAVSCVFGTLSPCPAIFQPAIANIEDSARAAPVADPYPLLAAAWSVGETILSLALLVGSVAGLITGRWKPFLHWTGWPFLVMLLIASAAVGLFHYSVSSLPKP